LQRLGVIEYCRGHITILDRPLLEDMCCECYAVVKKETERLLPWSDHGVSQHTAPPEKSKPLSQLRHFTPSNN